MSTSSARKIVLWSSDGESFVVEEAVALQSQTIKHMVEDDCADNGIPLPNVTSKILSKVIEYCNRHSDSSSAADGDLKLWDDNFVKVDRPMLHGLFLGANYLDIKSLLDLTYPIVLKMWKWSPTKSVWSPRTIVLRSSDGESFEVEEAVALQSQTIKHMVEDDCADNGIPLPNVTSKILSKVIEYCNHHVNYFELRDAEVVKVDQAKLFELIVNVTEYCKRPSDSYAAPAAPAADYDLKLWDAEFVKVDQATLFDVILAANYLNIKNLLDLTCQTVAYMIKGMTPKEIKNFLNLRNDFTPEEEEEVRRENQWAFE